MRGKRPYVKLDWLKEALTQHHNLHGHLPPKEQPCLVWPWTTCRGGYGQVWIDGKFGKVHRVAYELTIGKIPDGMEGCHSCDNPPCFAPHHIFPGTRLDNARDAKFKGRHAVGDRHGLRMHPERAASGNRNGSRTHPERLARGDRNGSKLYPERMPRGESHPSSKLTADQVAEIKNRLSLGENQYDIAARFSVVQKTISNIKLGRTWQPLGVHP